MIAIGGMIACGVGFLGFAGVYFWPTLGLPKLAGNQVTSTAEITVHNLFEDDFQTGSYKMIQGLETPLYKDGKSIGTFPFEIGFYGDFQAKSLFMSFYAPASDHAFELISWFSNAYKDYLYDAKRNIHVWTASPSTQTQSISDDLVFTKKVYMYHENILSTAQMRTLADLYAREGAEVEFRGFNYMDYRKKLGPSLSATFDKAPQVADGPPTPWPPFTPDPANQKQPTLITLFMTELRAEHGSAIIGKVPVSMHFAPNDIVQNLNLLYAIYYDRTNYTISVAIYLPHYQFTPNVILFAIPQIRLWLDEARKIQESKLIEKKQDLQKFKFSGSVYIYNEEIIVNEAAKAEIAKAMEAAGLSYEYRNQDYLMMFRYQVETRSRPMPPLYEWVDETPTLVPGQKDGRTPERSIYLPAPAPQIPAPRMPPVKN